MDKNNQNIEDLFIKFIDSEISENELAFLKDWISQSPENKQKLLEFCKLFHAIDAFTTISQVDSSLAFSEIRQKIKKPKKNLLRLITYQRVAAILFIPLFAISLYLILQKRQHQSLYTVYSTNPGMIAQIKLPDSSVVWLNADSKIKVANNFEQNRSITLDGEAFFDVKKDPKHEFTVQTPYSAKIAVLGTRFNVDAYSKNKLVRTTLEEGKIALTFKENGEFKKIIMSKNQSIVYDGFSEHIIPNDLVLETTTAWKDNKILLKNTSLEELANILYKRFHARIIIKTPALSKEHFTGELDTQTLQSVLEYLKISSGIQYNIVESLDKHTIIELSK